MGRTNGGVTADRGGIKLEGTTDGGVGPPYKNPMPGGVDAKGVGVDGEDVK